MPLRIRIDAEVYGAAPQRNLAGMQKYVGELTEVEAWPQSLFGFQLSHHWGVRGELTESTHAPS